METADPIRVKMIECSRRSCSHILTEEERLWKPVNESRRTAVCPQCGCESFFTLNERGQRTTFNERANYRDGVLATDIFPTERMGPKRKMGILRVKKLALGL